MKKDVEKLISEILEENNLKLGYAFDFPMYKQLPDEVALAMKILEKHGLKVLMTLEPKE